MNRQILITAVIIILLAAGGYLWYSMANTVQAPVTENPIVDIEIKPVAMTHAVMYTDSGYSPATLTIKAGDTVVFKNQSSGNVWTGSAMHPTHMGYGGTNLQNHCPDVENNDFDQCQNSASGTSWSFTFNKVGSWGYHNHSKPIHFGKIVVE